jgi:hypothetical protein
MPTDMCSQYKTRNHRNEVLIALRLQAVIFGASILYFILEYFFNVGIHVVEIRVLFPIGLFCILITLTFLLVKRFKKYLQLSEHLILSYNLSFKIFSIAITLLIFFIIITAIDDINLLNGYPKLNDYFKSPSLNHLKFALLSTLKFIIIFEAYLHVVPLIAIKHFNFYYAKTLVKSSLYEQKEDEVKRIKHLFVGINSYRKYLRNHLDLDIDTSKVYPKITVLAREERNKLINSLYEAFSEDADKLKPIICLTIFLNAPAEEVLVKEHTRDKIKQLSLLFIPIITVTISIFQLLIKR